MLITRRKPNNYFDNFDLLFENIFNESSKSHVKKCYHYNETEEQILIEIALPGINKNDIQLSYLDGFIKIKYKDQAKNSKWVKSLNESIKIAKEIDENKIGAKFKNGIMYINIPKKIKKNKEKNIEIK